MRHRRGSFDNGFTLVELVIGLTVLSVVALSLTGLFTALVNSSVIAKQKAVASTLATNQMEYLKSLPYDNLAVAGGSIFATNPIPATTTQKLNGVKYTIKTDISYVDDAYDGCVSYPNVAVEQAECRNFTVHTGAPTSDSNAADYKICDVSVYNPAGARLAEVNTEISARVAETASTTGALFITVIDSTGNPVSGATVGAVDASVGPVNVSDTTDTNGIAIFYGLPNDSTARYVVTASKAGYSTLSSIAASGSLVPTYPNQKILSQQSSFLTLTIKLQGPSSLLVETTDTTGNPLPNAKIYLKGGYKKYTLTTDTQYYYDSLTPSDVRPTTDSSGFAGVTNLVPGPYIFCGDLGATSCTVGGTTYYLAAAVPYGGTNSLQPITVPTYDPSNPPATTYAYNSTSYYQKVRLMLTTSSTFPRVQTLSPYDVSLSGGALSSFGFKITGVNLPCSSTPASCGTVVKFTQGANTYTAACTGTTGALLNCTVNLTGIALGTADISVKANGFTLSLPSSTMQGGLVVTP